MREELASILRFGAFTPDLSTPSGITVIIDGQPYVADIQVIPGSIPSYNEFSNSGTVYNFADGTHTIDLRLPPGFAFQQYVVNGFTGPNLGFVPPNPPYPGPPAVFFGSKQNTINTDYGRITVSSTQTDTLILQNFNGRIQVLIVRTGINLSPSITVNPTSGSSSTQFGVVGSGFTPNSTAAVILHDGSNTFLQKELSTDSTGSFTVSINPNEGGLILPVGSYTFTGYDKYANVSTPSISFSITSSTYQPPPPSPPPSPPPTQPPGTPTYPLQIILGAGGSVTGTGAIGYFCTQVGQCSNPTDNVPVGTIVTLKAIPNNGFAFSGWSLTGARISDTSAAVTSFVMPSNSVSVTANFISIAPVSPIPPSPATQKIITATIIVTAGSPIPTVTAQLVIDGSGVPDIQTITPDMIVIGRPITIKWSVDVSHKIQAHIFLDNKVGTSASDSNEVQT